MTLGVWGGDNTSYDSESAAAEALERDRAWLSVEEHFLLCQAYAAVCADDRVSRTILDRALAVISKLGDADFVVDGKPLRAHEPALVVAVALELARRWRTRAGSRDPNLVDVSPGPRREGLDAIRPSPEHFTITELGEIIGGSGLVHSIRGSLHVTTVHAGPRRQRYLFVSLAEFERELVARHPNGTLAISRVRAALAAARAKANSVATDDPRHDDMGLERVPSSGAAPIPPSEVA